MDEPTTRRHSKRVANAIDRKEREKYKKRGPNLSAIYCDFSRLDMASLKKYVSYYQLVTAPNPSKSELILEVTKHFSTKPQLREAEVISQFLYNTKCFRKQKNIK